MHRNNLDSKKFFDQWHLYKQIVDKNYMFHHEIINGLSRFLDNRLHSTSRILDLGCGDAYLIPKVLQGNKPASYIGLDLSPVALDLASKNLSAQNIVHNLNEYDFVEYLRNEANNDYDVIMSGYALHHLSDVEKLALFEDVYRNLNAGGCFIYFDVFMRESQSREQYTHEYCEMIRSEWDQLSKDSKDAAIEHVSKCDFPGYYSVIESEIEALGLKKMSYDCQYDSRHVHRTMIFEK